MRNYLYQSALRKYIDPNRSVTVTNLYEAESVGLLVDVSDSNDLAFLREFSRELQAKGKKISVLAYLNFSNGNDQLQIPFITKKNVNWYYLPKGNQVEQFLSQRYDVLLGAFKRDSPSLEYLTTRAQADFKVGPYLSAEKTYCFDLMVPQKEQDSLRVFVSRMTEMLTKLNANKVAT